MLRTDLFKTSNRVETQYIAVRDTRTLVDPELDVKYFDAIHCRKGKFGIGYHFLVLVSGDIQLGRDLETCGAHSRNLDDLSVGIGVVGGKTEEGERENTRTKDQLEALDDLVEFLLSIYPAAEVSDYYLTN